MLFKSEVRVDLGGTFLEYSEGLDDGEGHGVVVAGDVEVLEGALGLCSPEFVGWDVDGPEGVILFSVHLWIYYRLDVYN